jgi:superfamily II RNA helicase
VAPKKSIFRVKHDDVINEEQIALAFAGSQSPCLFQKMSECCELPNFAEWSRSGIGETCDWIGRLLNDEMGPLVVFCENQRMCYQIAEGFGNHCFVSEATSRKIKKSFTADLRQNEFAVRGIGIYHSGITAPFLDLIRTLFECKQIPVVVATSEFAIPAKTVFIHSLPKTKLEFFRMSECAGRRDFDLLGTVLIPISAATSQDEFIDFLKAAPEPYLGSSCFCFRSLLTRSPIDTSFQRFQEVTSLSAKRETMQKLKSEFKLIEIPNESITKLWIDLTDQVNQTTQAIGKLARIFSTVICPGTVIRSKNELGWGIVMSVVDSRELIVIHRAKCLSSARKLLPVDHPLLHEVSLYFVQVFQSDIIAMSTAVIDLSDYELSAGSIGRLSEKLNALFDAGFELIDERRFIAPGCLDRYNSLQMKLQTLNKMLNQVPRPSVQVIVQCRLKQNKMNEYKTLKQQIVRATTEYDQDRAAERELLVRLRYLDSEGELLPKGRAALLVHVGQEVLLVELVCSDILRVLTPRQIASLLGGFCADENPKTEVELPSEIVHPWSQLRQLHAMIGMDVNPISPKYVRIIWQWIGGVSIEELGGELDEYSDMSIVRNLMKTQTLLRQAARVASQVGDLYLELLLLQAIVLTKRNIASDPGCPSGWHKYGCHRFHSGRL